MSPALGCRKEWGSPGPPLGLFFADPSGLFALAAHPGLSLNRASSHTQEVRAHELPGNSHTDQLISSSCGRSLARSMTPGKLARHKDPLMASEGAALCKPKSLRPSVHPAAIKAHGGRTCHWGGSMGYWGTWPPPLAGCHGFSHPPSVRSGEQGIG